MKYGLKKLSEQTATTDPTDGYLYVIIDNGDGTFSSRKILFEDLVAGITLSNLVKLTDQNANFTQAFAANSKIEAIDIRYVSGSATIKIGTSLGGEEIMSEDTLSSGDMNLVVSKTFENATTLYFTLSGGVVHVNINYKPSYF